MEQLAGQVVGVLVGYALDRGAQLAKEGGQAAVDLVERLFQKVLDRVRADPGQATDADGFEKNPEGYRAPMEDAVRAEVRRDAEFGEELASLLAAIQQVAPSALTIVVTGSGAAAAHGGVAAGQGGAAAGAGGTAWVGTGEGSPKPPDTPSS